MTVAVTIGDLNTDGIRNIVQNVATIGEAIEHTLDIFNGATLSEITNVEIINES